MNEARRYVDECKELCEQDCPNHVECCKASCRKCAAKFADCKGDAGRKCKQRHNDVFLGVSCDSQAPAVCTP